MEGALRIDEKKVTPDFTADFAVTGTGKLFPPGALSCHTRARWRKGSLSVSRPRTAPVGRREGYILVAECRIRASRLEKARRDSSRSSR